MHRRRGTASDQETAVLVPSSWDDEARVGTEDEFAASAGTSHDDGSPATGAGTGKTASTRPLLTEEQSFIATACLVVTVTSMALLFVVVFTQRPVRQSDTPFATCPDGLQASRWASFTPGAYCDYCLDPKQPDAHVRPQCPNGIVGDCVDVEEDPVAMAYEGAVLAPKPLIMTKHNTAVGDTRLIPRTLRERLTLVLVQLAVLAVSVLLAVACGLGYAVKRRSSPVMQRQMLYRYITGERAAWLCGLAFVMLLSLPNGYQHPHVSRPLSQGYYDVLPEADVMPGSFNSCAVVGAAGIMTDAGWGAAIDAHDTVIRVNMSPTEGFESDVGSRTDYYFMTATPGHFDYATLKQHLPKIRSQGSGILYTLVSDENWYSYRTLRAKEPDLKVHLVNPALWPALDMYKSYITPWRWNRALMYGRRSTGSMALVTARRLCQNVDVYGFFGYVHDATGRKVHYHYANDHTRTEEKTWQRAEEGRCWACQDDFDMLVRWDCLAGDKFSVWI